MENKSKARGPQFAWGLVALAIGMFLMFTLFSQPQVATIPTSEGFDLLRGETVTHVLINGVDQKVTLELNADHTTTVDGKSQNVGQEVSFYYVVPQGAELIELVNAADLKDGFNSVMPQPGFFSSLLSFLLPLVIFVAIFWFLLSRMQGGAGGVMKFGKSRAKMVNKENPDVTFQDVAGVDEAVEELQEIKEFLSEPQKFQAVGAKIPKGVLLYGAPGTGKTLLARAVAGEAGVPFYSISASEFVEMFVGVGASRVRDLFDQAKANAPAIIFIDEIDAVGRHRGAGLGGGHDEREQTLNQLLVEMDGFDSNTNVILIAATNRPDVLDPALLRPGRFDRQISVDAPDLQGRLRILQVHAKGKPMSTSVDLRAVAKRTPGFTGADLANVLNEAALLTARSHAQLIDNRALDEAIDRVIAGPQKRTRVMNEKEKKITAYHEGGHALVAAALRYTDPVTKVTILPRGRALGYTMVMPTEDRYSTSRNELLDQLAYAMGGRVAEELVFHDPTTGASNDIEKATAIARKMVTQLGMSARIGSVKLGTGNSEPFLGRDLGSQRDYSEEVAGLIDTEVRALMDDAHLEAWEILNHYRDVLDKLVLELLERETLGEKELHEVFATVVKREPRPVWTTSPDRPVSTIPPVESPAEAAAGQEPEPPQDQVAHVAEANPAPAPAQEPPAQPQPPAPADGQ